MLPLFFFIDVECFLLMFWGFVCLLPYFLVWTLVSILGFMFLMKNVFSESFVRYYCDSDAYLAHSVL